MNASALSLNPAPPPLAWTLPGRDATGTSAFRPTAAGAQRPGAALSLLLIHALAIWGLLHLGGLRQAVLQRAPLFVAILTPSAAPSLPTSPAALPATPAALPAIRSAPVPPVPPPQALPQAVESDAPGAQPAVPVAVATTEAARPAAAATAPPASVAALTAPLTPTPPPAAPPAPRLIPASAIQTLAPLVADYPKASRRNAETGTVTVRAYIDAEGGAPRSVQIERSSGFIRLDQAALAAVQRARFKPSTENGRPVEGWALIPFLFELEK